MSAKNEITADESWYEWMNVAFTSLHTPHNSHQGFVDQNEGG
jgi:hypothetical protein